MAGRASTPSAWHRSRRAPRGRWSWACGAAPTLHRVPLVKRARSLALRLFAALPPRLRRALVRAGTTRYTVGCVAVVVRGDDVLLLEQPHRAGLTLPGGLLARHETPEQCLVRELREELGVELSVRAEPSAVLVDGRARRVDLVFLAHDDGGLEFMGSSAEVRAVHWRPLSALPRSTATARAIDAALRAERDRA